MTTFAVYKRGSEFQALQLKPEWDASDVDRALGNQPFVWPKTNWYGVKAEDSTKAIESATSAGFTGNPKP